MPQFVVPSMTITISATRTATSIDVSGLIVCDAPVNGNPSGPARMDFFIGGQYVGNTYGGPVESQPYHRQYTFSAPLSSILDSELANSVEFALYDNSVRFRVRGSLPISAAAVPVPQIVPGKILRALFWTNIEELQANPAIATAFHAAGVNTLHSGIFQSPVYSGETSLSQWITNAIDHPVNGMRAKFNWARAEGFYVIGTGDGLCRMPAERDWTNNTSWAADAIAASRDVCQEYSDVVAYIAMRDEQPGLPTDDPVYAKIVQAWRGGPGPKISWPNQRQPGDVWETSQWSDIDDRYAAIPVGGPLDGQQNTVWQTIDAVQRLANGVPVPGRPFVAIAGAMGPYYQKLVQGDDYHPGQDFLIAGGPTPAGTRQSIKAGVAYGASAIRVYAFDAAFVKTNRTIGAIGQSGLETGVKIGSPSWDAMAEAFNWIKDNEAALCGPYLPPVVSGGTVTGRRDGLSWTVDLLD